ncbi:unnamed protein product [Wuchereria bancrofti]|uniref:Uncharacterized protein n=1 Tax=Wuchereria bancrofti TaxID=6293 RepID=A0A3P7FIE9_WUCBA|nr:unnamed protein product [Wuchereria bancrofti]
MKNLKKLDFLGNSNSECPEKLRSYNSTYATSPAAAVYNATVQSQPTPHTPTLGAAVGATNPTSVYASFSSAAAPTASPYAAYANPTAAAAYAQYGQTAAAVASLQQQQQQQVQQVVRNYSNLQLQAAAATGVVSASAAAYPGHTATRLTDSYSTVGSVPSTGEYLVEMDGVNCLIFDLCICANEILRDFLLVLLRL